jgi:hypothetical protein
VKWISIARIVLARFLRTDPFDKESMPGIVVRSTAKGFVYEAPGDLTAGEVEAINVWLRDASKRTASHSPLRRGFSLLRPELVPDRDAEHDDRGPQRRP